MIEFSTLLRIALATCVSATGISFVGPALAAGQPSATLIIAHETDPDDATLFTYSLDGLSPGGAGLDDAPGPPNGYDNVINTKTFTVIPGDYVIAQSNPGSGWALDAIKCDGPTPAYANLSGRSVGLNVAAGMKITCRFYNRRLAAPAQGAISIQVMTAPGHPQDFKFTASGPNGFSQSFVLDNDTNAGNSALPKMVMFKNLGPGTYTFAELLGQAPGWSLELLTCGVTSPMSTKEIHPDSQSVKITLGTGQQLVSCTFRNRLTGKKAR